MFAHEVVFVVARDDVVDQRAVLLSGKELTRNAQTLGVPKITLTQVIISFVRILRSHEPQLSAETEIGHCYKYYLL